MYDEMMPVFITEKAVEEVHKIMQNKSIPKEYGLRVGTRGGGCGGMSFMLGFDKKKESDLEFVVDGIPVYIEKRHTMYLLGMEVDFYEGNDERGFTFIKREDG